MSSPAAILEPFIAIMDKGFITGDVESIANFYHPDSVIVHEGKQAIYGRDNMIPFFKSFVDSSGKSETLTSDQTYEASENYIAYSAKFTTESEKLGKVVGSFTQIWKNFEGKWLVVYDIFRMI